SAARGAGLLRPCARAPRQADAQRDGQGREPASDRVGFGSIRYLRFSQVRSKAAHELPRARRCDLQYSRLACPPNPAAFQQHVQQRGPEGATDVRTPFGPVDTLARQSASPQRQCIRCDSQLPQKPRAPRRGERVALPCRTEQLSPLECPRKRDRNASSKVVIACSGGAPVNDSIPMGICTIARVLLARMQRKERLDGARTPFVG